MATELWWISVGGNDCEPARVTENKMVYTIACPDGTLLTPTCGIILVEKMEPPLTPAEAEKERRAWERRMKQAAHHGYRKFD